MHKILREWRTSKDCKNFLKRLQRPLDELHPALEEALSKRTGTLGARFAAENNPVGSQQFILRPYLYKNIDFSLCSSKWVWNQIKPSVKNDVRDIHKWPNVGFLNILVSVWFLLNCYFGPFSQSYKALQMQITFSWILSMACLSSMRYSWIALWAFISMLLFACRTRLCRDNGDSHRFVMDVATDSVLMCIIWVSPCCGICKRLLRWRSP